MCLMIDGMDQKKTCLPHLRQLPKDINDECLVQMQLVGCLAYIGTVKPHFFVTYPNVHNGPNLIVTMIQRVLLNWGNPLPPILYVQLDNTTRENTNSTVFGYLSMSVKQCVLTSFWLVTYMTTLIRCLVYSPDCCLDMMHSNCQSYLMSFVMHICHV